MVFFKLKSLLEGIDTEETNNATSSNTGTCADFKESCPSKRGECVSSTGSITNDYPTKNDCEKRGTCQVLKEDAPGAPGKDSVHGMTLEEDCEENGWVANTWNPSTDDDGNPVGSVWVKDSIPWTWTSSSRQSKEDDTEYLERLIYERQTSGIKQCCTEEGADNAMTQDTIEMKYSCQSAPNKECGEDSEWDNTRLCTSKNCSKKDCCIKNKRKPTTCDKYMWSWCRGHNTLDEKYSHALFDKTNNPWKGDTEGTPTTCYASTSEQSGYCEPNWQKMGSEVQCNPEDENEECKPHNENHRDACCVRVTNENDEPVVYNQLCHDSLLTCPDNQTLKDAYCEGTCSEDNFASLCCTDTNDSENSTTNASANAKSCNNVDCENIGKSTFQDLTPEQKADIKEKTIRALGANPCETDDTSITAVGIGMGVAAGVHGEHNTSKGCQQMNLVQNSFAKLVKSINCSLDCTDQETTQSSDITQTNKVRINNSQITGEVSITNDSLITQISNIQLKTDMTQEVENNIKDLIDNIMETTQTNETEGGVTAPGARSYTSTETTSETLAKNSQKAFSFQKTFQEFQQQQLNDLKMENSTVVGSFKITNKSVSEQFASQLVDKVLDTTNVLKSTTTVQNRSITEQTGVGKAAPGLGLGALGLMALLPFLLPIAGVLGVMFVGPKIASNASPSGAVVIKVVCSVIVIAICIWAIYTANENKCDGDSNGDSNDENTYPDSLYTSLDDQDPWFHRIYPKDKIDEYKENDAHPIHYDVDIKLNEKPQRELKVIIASCDSKQKPFIAIWPTTFTFTPQNWDETQRCRIYMGNDVPSETVDADENISPCVLKSPDVLSVMMVMKRYCTTDEPCETPQMQEGDDTGDFNSAKLLEDCENTFGKRLSVVLSHDTKDKDIVKITTQENTLCSTLGGRDSGETHNDIAKIAYRAAIHIKNASSEDDEDKCLKENYVTAVNWVFGIVGVLAILYCLYAMLVSGKKQSFYHRPQTLKTTNMDFSDMK